MPLREFRDDDEGYRAWVAENADGYVLNIGRSMNPSGARIHGARCWTITGEPARGKAWTGPWIKFCAVDLAELEAWTQARVRVAVQRCQTCNPTAA